MREVDVPVLIVGGGPVGLALAVDLGWRGIAARVVEQEDGTIDHPRANAENARTMEFFRRWGIADAVRTSGTPQDFTQAVVYATNLGGYEIARIDRPGHGGAGGTAISPERPQRCNQLWLDPILRERASSFPSIDLRYRCRFESFAQDADGVDAIVRDLASGEEQRVRAQYLAACCGGRSSVGQTLGIGLQGPPAIEYNLNIFVYIENLWSYGRLAEAAMYFLVAPEGIWRTLIDIDGRSLWRLGLRGKAYYDDPAAVDVATMLREVIGADVPFREMSRRGWVARDLVADSYGSGRVFLAGDAAHQNTPSGGFGMNTGIGDAVDRAPHAVLAGGRSILDLFGRGFVLLTFGAAADSARIGDAFRAAGVPLTVHAIGDPAIAALYERRLVLVRPDGHVAWRGDVAPDDPASLAATVRGARALRVERAG